MKILWICNKKPNIASAIRQEKMDNFGGWMDSMIEELIVDKSLNLCILYPDEVQYRDEKDNLSFYSFNQANCFTFFRDIINVQQPDIIHIWGTEFSHSNECLKVCQDLHIIEKCILSIQGLVSIYGKYHYTEGIPNKVINRYTLRDFIRKDNIKKAREKFIERGNLEIEAIQRAKHIIGRTDWDRAIVEMYNPTAKYHFCNESLRGSFYENIWDIKKIERYSIFVSQCNYPIKGFHYMLEAFSQILREYPRAQLYTTGIDLLHFSFKKKMLISSYQLYLIELIKKYKLENNITFLGSLSEKEMCSRYLKSHVFVSASTIENSPNSVGEAMLLGCPVVTSDVGGVKNMIEHGKEGFVYQTSAPYMLSYYVKKIFENDELAMQISSNERKHAIDTHSREKNKNVLLEIYGELQKYN